MEDEESGKEHIALNIDQNVQIVDRAIRSDASINVLLPISRQRSLSTPAAAFSEIERLDSGSASDRVSFLPSSEAMSFTSEPRAVVRTGRILARTSTVSLLTVSWEEQWWMVTKGQLLLYATEAARDNGLRRYLTNTVRITANLRVLSIKQKEYPGRGSLYNFMLNEISGKGALQIGKFASSDRNELDLLAQALRESIDDCWIERTKQFSTEKGFHYGGVASLSSLSVQNSPNLSRSNGKGGADLLNTAKIIEHRGGNDDHHHHVGLNLNISNNNNKSATTNNNNSISSSSNHGASTMKTMRLMTGNGNITLEVQQQQLLPSPSYTTQRGLHSNAAWSPNSSSHTDEPGGGSSGVTAVKAGKIYARASTVSLLTANWEEQWWSISKGSLSLFTSQVACDKNLKRGMSKSILINPNLRVLPIKLKEYSGKGLLYNFMLEEITSNGPVHICKFASLEKESAELLLQALRDEVDECRLERTKRYSIVSRSNSIGEPL